MAVTTAASAPWRVVTGGALGRAAGAVHSARDAARASGGSLRAYRSAAVSEARLATGTAVIVRRAAEMDR